MSDKDFHPAQEPETSASTEMLDLPHPSMLQNTPPFHPEPFNVDRHYQRRISISFGFSVLINFLLLWLLFGGGGMPKKHAPKKSLAKMYREIPRIVLTPKPQFPKLPPTSKPQIFQETDPSQASAVKPTDAEFYSEHNTLAAQPDPSEVKSDSIPKADGNNTKTFATADSFPIAKTPPSPPHPDTPQKKETETSPVKPPSEKPPPTPRKSVMGDVALFKPQPPQNQPTPQDTPPTPPKKDLSPFKPPPIPPAPPPTPASQRQVPAAKSRLNGGVPRSGKSLAFNSAESPFAPYDKKIISKIGTYWQYQVIDKYFGEKVGEVEISFKLMADGGISDIRVTRNTANLVLAGWCIQAIEKSAPFEPFPEFMKVMVGNNRDASITFAY